MGALKLYFDQQYAFRSKFLNVDFLLFGRIISDIAV